MLWRHILPRSLFFLSLFHQTFSYALWMNELSLGLGCPMNEMCRCWIHSGLILALFQCLIVHQWSYPAVFIPAIVTHLFHWWTLLHSSTPPALPPPPWLTANRCTFSLFNWRAPLIAICCNFWWWWRNSKAKWRHQSGVVSAAAAAAHLERSAFLLVLLLPALANGMTSVHPILSVLVCVCLVHNHRLWWHDCRSFFLSVCLGCLMTCDHWQF